MNVEYCNVEFKCCKLFDNVFVDVIGVICNDSDFFWLILVFVSLDMLWIMCYSVESFVDGL